MPFGFFPPAKAPSSAPAEPANSPEKARGMPSWHDTTRPSWHGLWIDKDGNLVDAHRRDSNGDPLPVRGWFGKGPHPSFGIARAGSTWFTYQSPDSDTGDVLLAWYSAGKVFDKPAWLMLREAREGPINPAPEPGSLYYSIWYPEHINAKAKRRPSSAPTEKLVKPSQLDQIEAVLSFGAGFSGLNQGFRQAWAKRHGTVVQKRLRGTTSENPSALEIVGTGLGVVGKEAGRAAGELAGDLGGGLLSGFFGTKAGKAVVLALVLGAGAFLFFRFGRAR